MPARPEHTITAKQRSSRRSRDALAATLALAFTLTVAACAGSSSTAGASSTAGDGVSLAPSATSASGPAGSATGGGGAACDSMRADAQAVLAEPITGVRAETLGGPIVYGCEFDYSGGSQGSSLSVQIDPVQADSTYANLRGSGSEHDVSGIGDKAYWIEAVAGHTTPGLTAQKGSVACVILPPDPPDSTLKFSGAPPMITVADGDATAFVQLLGKVCNDAFAAE